MTQKHNPSLFFFLEIFRFFLSSSIIVIKTRQITQKSCCDDIQYTVYMQYLDMVRFVD